MSVNWQRHDHRRYEGAHTVPTHHSLREALAQAAVAAGIALALYFSGATGEQPPPHTEPAAKSHHPQSP